MAPHQERVVEEHEALDEKTQKLEEFIVGEVFATLPVEEAQLLLQQVVLMRTYRTVLANRIELFRGE